MSRLPVLAALSVAATHSRTVISHFLILTVIPAVSIILRAALKTLGKFRVIFHEIRIGFGILFLNLLKLLRLLGHDFAELFGIFFPEPS